MTYSLTIFPNVYDNKTHRRMDFETWDGFEHLLFDLSKKDGKKGGDDSSPLITPAIFRKNTTRANDNVLSWAKWCCIDVDDFDGTIENVLAPLKEYYYVCYSTASSTKDAPKFRVVFPLTDSVAASRIKHFWHSINSLVLGVVDAQTKDLCRMFYVPAVYPNAHNFIFKNEGKIINPFELMSQFPYYANLRRKKFIDTLPKELQKEVVNYRKNQLDNIVTWKSYKDCKFFPQDLGREYIANAGVANGGNFFRLYRIMIYIAGSAIKNNYPISASEIVDLCQELDRECGNIYKYRNMESEAEHALEFALKG
jgi:hypothetical protein